MSKVKKGESVKRKQGYKRNVGRRCQLIVDASYQGFPKGSIGIIRAVRGSCTYQVEFISPNRSHGTIPIYANQIKLLPSQAGG